MPCYNPLNGWRSRVRNKNGKFYPVFDIMQGYSDMPMTVPCGRCVGCRLERSRQWAMRCMHEASMNEDNCFITLTYNDKNIPQDNSLHKEEFQNFMKRLRKEISPKKVRFFHCGEYGSNYSRPHFHALLFGIDFRQMMKSRNHLVRKGDYPLTDCAMLRKLWKKGFNAVGDLTFESAAYAARYCTKVLTGDRKEDYIRVDENTGVCYELSPEYATMSRRPGIGKTWYDKYKSEVFPSDNIVMRGRKMKPPKFYDQIFEIEDQKRFKVLKFNRKESINKEENSERRLRVREKVAEAKLKNSKRRFEV